MPLISGRPNADYGLPGLQQGWVAPAPDPMQGQLYFDGKPKPIGYQGWTDTQTGNLLDQFKMGDHVAKGDFNIPTFDEVNMDPTALNRIKEQAFNSGPSAWAQVANLAQARNQQDAFDSAASRGSGANAQAVAQLSRLGGIGGGAMERLATQNQRDTAFSQNAILRQGMSDKSGIGLQDASQKNQLLQSIPGFESNVANLKLSNNAAKTDINKFNASNAQDLAKYNNTVAAQGDQFNIQNKMGSLQGQNAFNEGTYAEQMKAWAANKQAAATAASNTGGSWLCTEAHKQLLFDEVQKKLLSVFLHKALKIDRETTRFYILRCQPLLSKMKEKGANWGTNAQFVKTIIELADQDKIKEAFDLYCDYTINCIEKYWPECRDPSFLRIQQIRKPFNLESKGA